MPATVAAVSTFLGLTPARPVDDDALTAAVAAANDWVSEVRPDLTVGDDGKPLPLWPPRATQAAVQYAARLYGRRGSVQGVAAFQDVGVTLLPALDPDIRSLLELGNFQRSVVA
jgi:hypothetical protein